MRWTTELVVGLFVLAALALFAYFTVRIGDFQWGQSREHWSVRFEDVSGLREGDPVLALGKRIGKVDWFELRHNHVVAHLIVHHPVVLRRGYQIAIRAPSMLASHHVFIDPGPPTNPVVPSRENLEGRAPAGMFAEAIRGAFDELGGTEGGLGKLVVGEAGYAKLTATLEKAESILTKLERADGFLGAQLLGKEAYARLSGTIARSLDANKDGALGPLLLGAKAHADLADTLANTTTVMKHLAEGDGALGRLLLAEKARKSLDSTLASASELAQGLNADGGLGKALVGQETHHDLTAAVARLKSLSAKLDAGKGALGAMLLDEATHDDLREGLKSLRSLTAKLDQGDGALGQLLLAETTRKSLDAVVADAREITSRLKGDGGLGRLLFGQESYGKLADAVGQVETAVRAASTFFSQMAEAVEDAREQAPISTFTSTLLGGFR